MATSTQVLEMLIPTGGWAATGHDWEGVQFLEATPITKEQFDQGLLDYDAWKADKDKKESSDKLAAKQAVLDKLGLTADEVAALLS